MPWGAGGTSAQSQTHTSGWRWDACPPHRRLLSVSGFRAAGEPCALPGGQAAPPTAVLPEVLLGDAQGPSRAGGGLPGGGGGGLGGAGDPASPSAGTRKGAPSSEPGAAAQGSAAPTDLPSHGRRGRQRRLHAPGSREEAAPTPGGAGPAPSPRRAGGRHPDAAGDPRGARFPPRWPRGHWEGAAVRRAKPEEASAAGRGRGQEPARSGATPGGGGESGVPSPPPAPGGPAPHAGRVRGGRAA